jgi:hypothetical protein
MQFVDKLIDAFPISQGGMHMANVQFGDTAKVIENKGQVWASTKVAAKSTRSKITHGATGANTMMNLAVDEAVKLFSKSRGAVDVLLVITDGLPTGGIQAGSPSDVAFRKARAEGKEVLFVLIGNLFRWLKLPSAWMSSEPVQISNFAALEKAHAEVIKMVCKTAQAAQVQTVHTTVPPVRLSPWHPHLTAAPLRKYHLTAAPLQKYVRRETPSPTSAPTQRCCRTAASCSAVGDPHYRTFDGKKFNFFGLGEHYLMKNSKLTIKSTTGGCKCNGGCQRWCRNQPSFNTKIEIQVLGSNESLTIENAPGVNGYNKLKMPAKFPGATIKMYRSSRQPNLDKTFVTFDSLGVKVRVNAWQYHKTRGGFYATDGGIDKGMDVWVQTTPRFACGKVTGLCGNFDCNRNNDLPGWHLRRWPAMQPRNEPPSPPVPPITNYCDANSNLKTKATGFCSKFTVDTRHDCMEDICLTGQIITGMEQELQEIDETDRVVKADVMAATAAATGSLHATQLVQRSSSLAEDWTPVDMSQLIASQ